MLCCKETQCFTAEWSIKNFSLFSTAGRNPVRSPVFKTESTHGAATWWRLLVYYSDSNVDFQLLICEGESAENDLYEMSLFTTYREVLVPLNSHSVKSKIFVYSIKKDDIFGFNGHSFLPQDTLTIYCRIRQEIIKPERCMFRTVLHSVNFVCCIKKFNFLDSINRTLHQQDTLQLITMIYKNPEKGTHKVRVETQPNIECFPSFVNCKLSIKDGRGECISSNFIHPTAGWLWDIIIYDKEHAVGNLQLELQSLIAVERNYQPITTKCPPPISDSISAGADPRSSSTHKEDLLLLYLEELHTDAILNTKEKSFPAHKNILAARSKVFRAMFEGNHTTEGLSGIVTIEDIDSETLDRMLVFLYSDTLEDVQWEDALTLYYAADKYAIQSLKLRCADILKAGINISNVCLLLVVADNHSDEQLMKVIIKFIRDHDEVISSDEWTELENNNSKLTTKVMRNLYFSQRNVVQIQP